MPPFSVTKQREGRKETRSNIIIADIVARVVEEVKLYIPAPIKGDKGDTGPQGERGVRGEQGKIGPRGETGPQGRDGIDGRDGKDGTEVTEEAIEAALKPYIEDIKKELARTKQRGQGVGSVGGGGDSILYQSISSDTTINVSSKVVLVDTSSGDVTVTLPPVAQTARREYHIKKDDNSSNVVTVDPSGSETIDGETTEIIIGSYTSLRLYSTGTKWVII